MPLNNNPFINRPIHKYGTVAFNDIKPEHYIPAINYAIKKAEDTLEIIKNSSDDPTFDNTVLPMETCTELLDSISTTYFNIMGAESDNNFKDHYKSKLMANHMENKLETSNRQNSR